MKYEAHITVEPSDKYVHGISMDYAEFVERNAELGWKASKFEHDDVDEIAGKWFLSYGHDDFRTIVNELKGMVHGLSCSGFNVLRAKLEETVFDTKHGDLIDELNEDCKWRST